jgi:Holliday junction resolvase
MKERVLKAIIKEELEIRGYYVRKINERFSSGFPDLICIKDGRVIFIELKVEDNKPTPLQHNTLMTLAAKGAEALIIRQFNNERYVTKYNPDGETMACYYHDYKF